MSKIKFIFYCTVINCAVIFLSPLDFSIRFFGSALLLFFGGVFLLKQTPFQNKKKSLFFIFGFWFSLISIQFVISFFVSGFLGMPIILISILAIIAAILFYKKERALLLKISLSYIILISLLTYLLPSYYAYIFHEENKMVNKPLPHLTIYDEKGIPYDLKKGKGKILVFDLWNSSCNNCIKAFPKFDELREEFKNDTTVCFYSLNIPLSRDLGKKNIVIKFTENFNFGKLYTDKKTSNLLNIDKVPQYMIVDKNQTIKYIGDLNTEKSVFYDNFYNIINKLKQ